MDKRVKIPTLALLGLSFTECTARDAPERDPIVGVWTAVDVDGTDYPMSFTGDGYSSAFGIEMNIEADLDGDLVVYIRDEDELLRYDKTYGSDILVDAAAAPNYRIDVASTFLDRPSFPEPTGGYYYDDYGQADGDDDPPLAAAPAPRAAPAAMVLNCTLDQDTLTCAREGDGAPSQFVFTRKMPEET